MPDLINTDLSQNYRKTAPSSHFGTRDLAFYGVFLEPNQNGSTPFEITFLGNTYNRLYVGTNSYITFGDGTSNYSFGDDATMDGAELPGILVSENDNSYQWVYSKTTGDAQLGTRAYTVRYEGTNDSSASFNHGPNIVWEVTFYEDKPGIVDLVVVRDAGNRDWQGNTGNSVSGVTDGTNWVDDYFGGNQFQGWGKGSYRIDTTSGTQAEVTPGTAVEQTSLGMQIDHQFNHDTGGSTNNASENNDYVEVQGCVWNGSDYAKAVRALQQAVELYYIGQPKMGMGVEFVIAIANDTATYTMADNALDTGYDGGYGFAPMVVGPESIYVNI